MYAELLSNVPGGPELLAWFDGEVPPFDGAEVLSISLDRCGPRCAIDVHTFILTSEIDSSGFLLTRNHVTVRFELIDLLQVKLQEFNHQNVLDSLNVNRGLDAGYVLELEGTFGLLGLVEGRSLEISLTPGIPPGSEYRPLIGTVGPRAIRSPASS